VSKYVKEVGWCRGRSPSQTYGNPVYFSSTWASPVFTFTGGGGPTRAQVGVPYSRAVLVNGSYCVSAGPSAERECDPLLTL